jgi:hypothetical protein
MELDSRNQRRSFGGGSLAWLAGCLLSVFVAMVVSPAAHASIEFPQPAAISLEDLQPAAAANASSAGTSGGHSGPIEQPSQDGNERDVHRLVSPSAIPPGGSTSGSSSSGIGAGASSVSALCPAAAILLYDADLVRWFAGDERLALPTPPGNVLLRPPQSV